MKPFATLRYDLPASVVVFFVAVPLCLGIALASGAPLFSGLIAGIIGGIVVGAISGASLGVSGPAAGLAVVVLNAIHDLGTFETFLLAVVIAGVFQLVLGVARAGVLAYFFPSSVIKGMLAGIGILIILKQIPLAVGHDTDPEGDMRFVEPDGDTTLSSLYTMLDHISPSAMFVAGVALAILLVWDQVLSKRAKFFQVVQGPLVAVAFGVLFELITKRFAPDLALSRDHLVTVPIAKDFDAFLGLFTHPDWSQITNAAVWVTGITLAVVASLETLLSVEAIDKLDPMKRVTPTNRELFAQGIGNVSAGLIGVLPITQVIVRSSANVQSGGRTKLSAILHGIFILVFVLALPELLNLIPLAALASILIVVGYKLAKPALFRQMYGYGRSQFLPFTVTIVGIVFTDLLTGIALGMGVALFVLLRSHYLNSHFMHIHEERTDGRSDVTIRLAEEVTFLNKGAILKELDSIKNGSSVTIDATGSFLVDHDVLEIIRNFESSAPHRDITVRRVGNFSPSAPGPRSNRPANAESLIHR